ncbi:unnamed protein product, partial [marine sediment metagenome]
DMIYHAQMWLTEGDLSPHDTSFKLNDIPMSALGKPRGYQKPREAFKLLAASCESEAGESGDVSRPSTTLPTANS